MSAQAFGWVLDQSESTGSARLVAVAIANHVSSDTAEGWCYVSTILASAKVSRDSYQRAMKQLEALGEFERVTNAGGTASTRADAKPNLYRMPKFGATRPLQNAHPAGKRPRQPAGEGPPQPATPATPAGCPPIPLTGLTVSEPSTTTGVEAALAEGFDRFWAVYPRRVGKPSALKAWAKAVKAAGGPEAIIDGARRYAAGCEANARKPEYIKHPGPWLNDERWTDPPEAAPAKPGARPIMQPGYEGMQEGRVAL